MTPVKPDRPAPPPSVSATAGETPSDAPRTTLWEILKDFLPGDHARQVTSTYHVPLVMAQMPKGASVLDLGCGTGRSVDLFREVDPQVEWHGLDIASSPEVAARTRTDTHFHTYDGVHIPFEPDTFHVVYSHQVFEHVRHPDALLEEVARVLRPGGVFIGSVASLEPYHSFSYWNFTPYGWHVLLEEAGLQPVEYRPGIDGIALIRRHYLGRRPNAGKWFVSSPLNEEIDRWATTTGRRAALVNLRKTQFCGHLVFHARKNASG